MAGKVWLVGAGPADGGLLTLKGKAVLDQAEVVVYDALVGERFWHGFPQAEKINVENDGCHRKTQEQINEILWTKAREGKRVVRLKGGDPFPVRPGAGGAGAPDGSWGGL